MVLFFIAILLYSWFDFYALAPKVILISKRKAGILSIYIVELISLLAAAKFRSINYVQVNVYFVVQ